MNSVIPGASKRDTVGLGVGAVVDGEGTQEGAGGGRRKKESRKRGGRRGLEKEKEGRAVEL